MPALSAAAALFLLGLPAVPQDTAAFAALAGTVRAPNARTAGAVVYLVPRDSAAAPLPVDTGLVDQRDLRFVPRTLVVLPGTTVEFRNSDPILHNVFSPPGVAEGFDLGIYPRTERRLHTFTAPGAHVILCHVHPEMVAYIVVVPTPWYAVVDDEGRFRITGVPPGRYRLRVWHRRAAPFEQSVDIERGERHVEIELLSAARRRAR